MNTKGQITIFIIMGILLLFAFGFVFYIASITKEVPAPVPSIERAPLEDYASQCLSMVVERGARLAALQGGYINPRGSIVYGDTGDKYFVHYYYGGLPVSYGLLGTQINLPDREQLQTAISRFALVELDDCLDLKGFEKQNFVISKPEVEKYAAGLTVPYAAGELAVSVVIRDDDIFTSAHYPIMLERIDRRLVVEDFTATVPVRLGRVHATAMRVLKETAASTRADKEYRISDHCNELSAPDGGINLYFVPNNFRRDYLLRVVDATPLFHARAPLKFHTGVRNALIRGVCIG